MSKNFIYWILGLSGSGKTTLSKLIRDELIKRNRKVILLDGDNLRKIFDDEDIQNSYTRQSRLKLAFKYSKLCQELSGQGNDVVIATISMFDEIYKWNKKNLKGYVEVFLDVPMDILFRRDPKNLYKNFKEHKITNVVGCDISPDIPFAPNKIIKYTNDINLETYVNDIIENKN